MTPAEISFLVILLILVVSKNVMLLICDYHNIQESESQPDSLVDFQEVGKRMDEFSSFSVRLSLGGIGASWILLSSVNVLYESTEALKISILFNIIFLFVKWIQSFLLKEHYLNVYDKAEKTDFEATNSLYGMSAEFAANLLPVFLVFSFYFFTKGFYYLY